MTLFHSIILGLVEGLTEFLPISSTGHMVLVSHFLDLPEGLALSTFEIVIQIGAISAVIVLYLKKLFDLGIIKKLVVGFMPTGVIGLLVLTVSKCVSSCVTKSNLCFYFLLTASEAIAFSLLQYVATMFHRDFASFYS
jgi:undecaprenyl-diphosphatase